MSQFEVVYEGDQHDIQAVVLLESVGYTITEVHEYIPGGGQRTSD
jgi:hypothetical protein